MSKSKDKTSLPETCGVWGGGAKPQFPTPMSVFAEKKLPGSDAYAICSPVLRQSNHTIKVSDIV